MPTIAKAKITNKPTFFSPLLLGCLLILFLGVQGLFLVAKPDNRVLGETINLEVDKIIELTNEKRQNAHLPPLRTSEKLTKAAQVKAADMIEFQYWDHFSPSKRPPWTFILEAGYEYHFAGENLAKDFVSSDELVNAWMASPDHKANILNDHYEDIGVAVISGKLNDKDTILVVQMFGSPLRPNQLSLPENNLVQNLNSPDPLTARGSLFSQLLSNRFLATKITAVFIILILVGLIIGDLIRHIQDIHWKMFFRKHGEKFFFILVMGAIIIITRDGNIL